jgi:hypothetical protein
MSDQPRPRTTHELKLWPQYFEQVRNGRMKFQLRRNDRDYKVGDQLLLQEWDPIAGDVLGPTGPQGHYSGRELLVRVDYIMNSQKIDEIGLKVGDTRGPSFIIMSISLVN